jgi:Ca2+-binding RTX toxin-like protein
MTDFTGNLGTTPNDVAISADGLVIYAAGQWADSGFPVQPADGDLRVYSASTGALLSTIHVGTRLGGVDLSPDGTFLMVTELAPAAGTNTVYKLDLATGAVQAFTVPVDPPSSPGTSDTTPFYDVAVLSDGTVLLSVSLQGGGFGETKLLDLATGTFTNGPHVQPSSYLSPSPDGSEVLIGQPWITNGPISIYTTGSGVVANTDGFTSGVTAGNWGIQALNQNTGLVAQWANGLHIYDEALHHQLVVTSDFLDGLTFDTSGEHLFVLNSTAETVVEYSTLNWAVVQTINVGQQFVGGPNDLGGRLLLSPDESYLTVMTSNGLLKLANPGATATVPGTPGEDNLTGTSGDDVIAGGAGNDNIDGGAGRDVIYGGDGNDAIVGGDGDDAISGGAGNDSIDGGPGNDTASYADAASGVTVNLSLTTAQDTHGAGVDTLQNLENLYGSAFGDTLIGDAGANVLRGQAGNDVLVGGAGNDELNGGAGFDTVDYSQEAGGGNALVNLGPGSIADSLGQVGPSQARDTYGNIDSLSSIEHIITGAGNDRVQGSSATERIETGAGNDFLNSGGGGDTLIGGPGNDTYTVFAGDIVVELANEGTDTVQTGLAAFVLPANVENLRGTASTGQSLSGNELDNVISGGSGNDTLIGGAGNDRLSGGLGNDTMTGGAGNDMFSGSAEGLNGDTITDFSVGDQIFIADANIASFSFSLSGSTLTYTGGSLTLGSLPTGHIIVQAGAAGGVQLTIVTGAVHDDFNGDGRSDILWRNDSGAIFNFLGTASGGFTSNGDNSSVSVDNSWHVAATGDFNGDQRSDILWRNDSGVIFNFLGTVNGGFSSNGDNSYVAVDNSWHVAGAGDFNGDGRSDILWRNDNGAMFDFLGAPNGGFTSNGDNSSVAVDNSWHIANVGDFNGDGRADILWRNDSGVIFDFLGTSNGGFASNGDNSYVAVDNSWHVAATGDFNGDGRADILWRNDNGAIFDFLGTGNGGFTSNGDNSSVAIDNSWHVASVGDFNGDGRADILWRNDSGVMFDFLGTANGGFTNNGDNSYVAVGTSSHVQDSLF